MLGGTEVHDTLAAVARLQRPGLYFRHLTSAVEGRGALYQAYQLHCSSRKWCGGKVGGVVPSLEERCSSCSAGREWRFIGQRGPGEPGTGRTGYWASLPRGFYWEGGDGGM